MNQMPHSKHIDALCNAYGLVYRRALHNRMKGKIERGVIRGPGIKKDEDYFTALHEIGHHAIEIDTDYPRASLLFCECDAWEWALANTKWQPSAAVKRFIGTALSSYRDHPKGATMPPPGHRFHELCSWKEKYAKPVKVKTRRLP